MCDVVVKSANANGVSHLALLVQQKDLEVAVGSKPPQNSTKVLRTTSSDNSLVNVSLIASQGKFTNIEGLALQTPRAKPAKDVC